MDIRTVAAGIPERLKSSMANAEAFSGEIQDCQARKEIHDWVGDGNRRNMRSKQALVSRGIERAKANKGEAAYTHGVLERRHRIGAVGRGGARKGDVENRMMWNQGMQARDVAHREDPLIKMVICIEAEKQEPGANPSSEIPTNKWLNRFGEEMKDKVTRQGGIFKNLPKGRSVAKETTIVKRSMWGYVKAWATFSRPKVKKAHEATKT